MKIIVVFLLAISAVISVGLLSGLITIDAQAGTYGVSIGTNNHYCSAEAFGHDAPSFGCESAR